MAPSVSLARKDFTSIFLEQIAVKCVALAARLVSNNFPLFLFGNIIFSLRLRVFNNDVADNLLWLGSQPKRKSGTHFLQSLAV